MLCRKAGEAVGMVIAWPLSKIGLGKGAGAVSGVLSSITAAGPGYFCEMGSGGQAPNLDSIYDDNATQVCDGKQDGYQQKLNDASTKWHAACAATTPPATCQDPNVLTQQTEMTYDDTKLGLSDIANLKSLAADVDGWYQKKRDFDYDDCKKDEKKEAKKKTEAKVNSEKSSSGDNSDKTPKKVDPDWKNGVDNAQFISLLEGDTSTLKIGPRGVHVGAFRDRRAVTPAEPTSASTAFAQAEFFYDCSGEWNSGSCNNEKGTNESAMWHFRWRARLRRYTRPNAIAQAAEELALGDLIAHARKFPLYSTDGYNERLRLQLQNAALSNVTDPRQLIVH
jgi:hypothetical protein